MDDRKKEAEWELAELGEGRGRGNGDPEAWSGRQRAHYAERLTIDFKANFGGRFDLVGFRPFGVVPSDAYLFLVMGYRGDGTYATWTYNATDNGFFSGHYDLTVARALELFEGRGGELRREPKPEHKLSCPSRAERHIPCTCGAEPPEVKNS